MWPTLVDRRFFCGVASLDAVTMHALRCPILRRPVSSSHRVAGKRENICAEGVTRVALFIAEVRQSPAEPLPILPAGARKPDRALDSLCGRRPHAGPVRPIHVDPG